MVGSTYVKYYDEKKILEETGWKGLGVKENAPNHLSILSQGTYDDTKNVKYDNNVYFPKSVGKDIDIFFYDIGFNFTYNDFTNSNERKIQCVVEINHGEVNEKNSTSCYSDTILDHGTWAAAVSAGIVNGIAYKANLYGGVRYLSNDLETMAIDLLAYLRYINDNLFREGKAVFNFSNAFYYSLEDIKNNQELKEIQELITDMSRRGAVFVASAGNLLSPAEKVTIPEPYLIYEEYKFLDGKAIVPCVLDHVICVGGIANMGLDTAGFLPTPPPYNDEMVTSNYKFASSMSGSNYGAYVDLYAPFNVHYTGSSTHATGTFSALPFYKNVAIDEKSEFIEDFEVVLSGTSFSAPIVSGVAAAIMSEYYPEKIFTSDDMLHYLYDHANNNTIQGLPENSKNVLLNIGKMSIFHPDIEVDSDEEVEVTASEVDIDIDSELDSSDEQ
jgi:hypothetical protein